MFWDVKKLKEAIECKAMENMEEAQVHYKRDCVKNIIQAKNMLCL